MSEADPDAGDEPATPWWAMPWWQALGVAVGLLGVLVGIGAWVLPAQRADDGHAAGRPIEAASTAVAASPLTSAASAASTASAPGSARPTPSRTSAAAEPATGPGVIFISGSPKLYTRPKADRDPDMWNLDRNQGLSTFLAMPSDLQQMDLSLDYRSLGAENGAAFAAWPGPGTPDLAACGALPANDWQPSLAQEALTRGAVYCVRTSDRRLGHLTVRDFGLHPEGEHARTLRALTLAFVLWKKPGD